jgi:chaperonin GroEL
MGIDDYLFNKNYDNILESPFEGVNHFLEKFKNKIKILSKEYRVFIEKIENCIKVTLGPTGKNGLVVTKNQGLKFLTNGSNIIKSLEFSNAESNTLLKLLEQIAVKTHSVAGDGSTITLLLACQLLKSSFRFLLSVIRSEFFVLFSEPG